MATALVISAVFFTLAVLFFMLSFFTVNKYNVSTSKPDYHAIFSGLGFFCWAGTAVSFTWFIVLLVISFL